MLSPKLPCNDGRPLGTLPAKTFCRRSFIAGYKAGMSSDMFRTVGSLETSIQEGVPRGRSLNWPVSLPTGNLGQS